MNNKGVKEQNTDSWENIRREKIKNKLELRNSGKQMNMFRAWLEAQGEKDEVRCQQQEMAKTILSPS